MMTHPENWKNMEVELLQAAYEAARYAYAPYSKFKVGAALLCASGKIYTGCNVENASFGAGICAERTAAAKAISAGEREISAIAVVCENRDQLFPCGICRQTLAEFGDPVVITDTDGTPRTYRLSELLPHSFAAKDIRLPSSQADGKVHPICGE